MNSNRSRSRSAGALLCLALLAPRPAAAYDTATHFRIASFAWQTMRAASDKKLHADVPWASKPDDATLLYPDELGACDIGDGHCAGATEASFREFVTEVGASFRRLNELAPGVPAVDAVLPELDRLGLGTASRPCNTTPAARAARDFSWRIGTHYRPAIVVNGEQQQPDNCTVGAYSWSGLYRIGPGAHELALPDDGTGLQGRVFGYHAQQPDNLWQDTLFLQSPVYGPLLGVIAAGVDEVSRLLAAMLACAWALVSKADFDDCVSDGYAHGVNSEELLKRGLPGWDGAPSSDLVGVWHFIRAARRGEFDDNPGMNYAKAGPGNAGPGAVDNAIRLASNMLYLRLDTEKSDGEDHYQIFTSEDGQRPTKRRAGGDFHAELAADLEFEPIDNLAQYGWARFRKSAEKGEWNAEGLAFPLHALGDATVPQHVVGSTGYGHRPYEEWVDLNLSRLLLESCKNDAASSPNPCDDDFLRRQIAQSRRILQWARFFHEQTRDDEGVRHLVTLVAEETLAKVGDSKDSWAFCDSCSTVWQLDHLGGDLEALVERLGLAGEEIVKHLGDGAFSTRSYGDHETEIRELVELGVGANVALLMKASEGRCDDLGESCNSGGQCCTGTCGSGSTCCRARGKSCADSSECCDGKQCNDQGLCCETSSGAACGVDGDCCSGKCNDGRCCKASLGASCTADAECCDGACNGGTCCTKGKGEACSQNAECCGGRFCGEKGTCCEGLGAACGTDGDCCSGSCKGGACAIACTDDTHACSSAAECCSGTCANGFCGGVCLKDREPCTSSDQCCKGTCDVIDGKSLCNANRR
jgi:hypothetical protein